MPILLYNLELTQDELLHLWVLLEMRSLVLEPDGLCQELEGPMLSKVKALAEIDQ